jgi:choloylglycine hydrolase
LLAESDYLLFGHNYDWHISDGLIVVNKKGVRKTAIPNNAVRFQQLSWISKFGSITFNQYGCELPIIGMNEKGLIVTGLILEGSAYPKYSASENRPYIGNAQWKQYVLDRFESIEEIIEDLSNIIILPPRSPGTHFMACDRNGQCVIIEYLNGKQKIFIGNELPVKVLTNSRYKSCINSISGETVHWIDQNRSLNRFIRAARLIEIWQPEKVYSNIDYAFQILSDVDQGYRTKWSSVWDVNHSRIYFNTLKNRKSRYLDLDKFDFSCQSPRRVLDLQTIAENEVEHLFIDYSREENLKLIRRSFGLTEFTSDLNEEKILRWSSYPDTLQCVAE